MYGVALVVLLLGAVSGCATTGRLAMTDAKVVPAKVAPGDEAVVCVTVIDPKGIVSEVIGTVREYPEFSFPLNDDGEEGDETAEDGIWSLGIEVPAEAPPGVYNWDFEAYDANGNLVKATSETGEEKVLTSETAVEIVF